MISAYKTTAKETLENCKIIQKTVDILFRFTFEYADMNKVMRIVKDNKLKILSQKMELNCEFLIPIRKKNANSIKQQMENLRCVKIKEIN